MNDLEQSKENPGTPHSNKKGHRSKFTTEEDKMLIKIVNEVGNNKWNTVSLMMPGRNARQCRERWSNYLDPKLENSPWTPEEEELLAQKRKEFGTKWVYISLYFPKRSINSVKNHFFAQKRKTISDHSSLPDFSKCNDSFAFMDKRKDIIEMCETFQTEIFEDYF